MYLTVKQQVKHLSKEDYKTLRDQMCIRDREQPERVVTLFDSNSDAVLALGVAPVGVSKVGYGNVEENGLLPWTNAAFEKLGVTPNVFDDTEETDYEAVNAAEPDLVLIPNSGVTEEEYERLSQIAPTVPYAKIAYATTWRCV